MHQFVSPILAMKLRSDATRSPPNRINEPFPPCGKCTHNEVNGEAQKGSKRKASEKGKKVAKAKRKIML